MIHASRIITALLTALVLLTGTIQMAYASGQAPAVDELVICSGHGAVTIGIDAEGNPTGEIFYCPDCASTALDAVSVQPFLTPVCCETLSEKVRATHLTPSARLALIELHARGPPAAV